MNTIFSKIYPEEYPTLPTTPLVPSIVFAGLMFGQLLFGYISDKCGRRVGMVAATIIIILFSALCAGAWYPTKNVSDQVCETAKDKYSSIANSLR